MKSIVPAGSDALATPDNVSPEAAEKLRAALKGSKSKNTLRAYKFDLGHLAAWCSFQGLSPKPPLKAATIAAYLADTAEGCKYATVARRLAAISWMHRLAESEAKEQGKKWPDNPTRAGVVREAMKGLKNLMGTRQTRKAPADMPVMKKLIATLGTDLTGTRDRALLLLGYAGAFRRTTLCSLDVADLTFHPDRLDVYLRHDKTSEARTVAIMRTNTFECPVRAVEEWLSAAVIDEGPVFRGFRKGERVRETRLSSQVVAEVVKTACEAAGLDPALYGGHSLRAGHITQATRQGARIDEIMRTTDHHSVEMVMRYVRDADPLAGTSATKIWDVPQAKSCGACGRALVLGKTCKCKR